MSILDSLAFQTADTLSHNVTLIIFHISFVILLCVFDFLNILFTVFNFIHFKIIRTRGFKTAHYNMKYKYSWLNYNTINNQTSSYTKNNSQYVKYLHEEDTRLIQLYVEKHRMFIINYIKVLCCLDFNYKLNVYGVCWTFIVFISNEKDLPSQDSIQNYKFKL